MIINRTYFKGDIFIPNMIDDVSDVVLDIKVDIDDFITEYVRNCLDLVLGSVLSKEFREQLDKSTVNGLKVTAVAKWNDLLNGKEYTIDGKTYFWSGIRFSNIPNEVPTMSFLAEYVFFYYLRYSQSNFAGVGLQREDPKNAIIVNSTAKATLAWRKFYNRVQGDFGVGTIIGNRIGYGIVWNSDTTSSTLYQFIVDMNKQTPNTYANYTPTILLNQNNFGI